MRSRFLAGLLLATAATGCGDAPLAPTPEPTAAVAAARNMVRVSHLTLEQLTASPLNPGQGFNYGPMRGSGNWGYTAPDGRRFALTGTSRGLSIDEVTDPARVRHIGIVEGPESRWREIRTLGSYAYVTTEAPRHGIDIIDLADPDRPRKVRTWSDTLTSAHSLWIDADRRLLFANGTNGPTGGGLRVLSLEDPENPREVGAFTRYYVHDSYMRGDVLFAAAINEGALAMLDVRDPGNITEITRFDTGGRFTHNAWLTDDGAYVLTTDERPDRPMEVWEIRDIRSPRKMAGYIAAAGTIPHNVMIDGSRALLSHYTMGVHLLDVRNPEQPSFLGSFSTHTGQDTGFVGCWGAYIFPGTNLIVASDIGSGLHVIEYRP